MKILYLCRSYYTIFLSFISIVYWNDSKHNYLAPRRYFMNVFILNVSSFFRRKSVLPPYNRYLVAVYECTEGYVFEDSTTDRLFCSDGAWLGAIPRCVKVEGNMGRRKEGIIKKKKRKRKMQVSPSNFYSLNFFHRWIYNSIYFFSRVSRKP